MKGIHVIIHHLEELIRLEELLELRGYPAPNLAAHRIELRYFKLKNFQPANGRIGAERRKPLS